MTAHAPAAAAPVHSEKDAKDGKSPKAPGVTPQPDIRRVLLTEVLYDHDWNARSKEDTERVIPENGAMAGYNPELESTGLGGGAEKTEPGLIEMITMQGQLDPADVRINQDAATKAKFPFRGVTGYRRHTSLTRIAEKAMKDGDLHPIQKDPSWDASKPTILVLVKPMTEFEARERNLNEGTSHNGLSTPDLAYGIEQLRVAAKEAGLGELTGAAVAKKIGKTEGYVSQIMKVNKLPKRILAHWRKGGKATFAGKEVVGTAPLRLELMYELASSTSHDEVELEYAKLLAAKAEGKGKNKSPEEKKLESARKQAKQLGEIIGWLGFNGIDPTKLNLREWTKVINECVCFTRLNGKDPLESQMRLLLEAAKEGYRCEQAKLAAPEDGTDGDDEEKNQKKRDKRDGGR